MKEPDRPTAPEVFLINAHKNPPASGSKVWALGQGGTLVPEVWNRNSIKFFDAWCKYPKIPDDVKEIQAARFTNETTRKDNS